MGLIAFTLRLTEERNKKLEELAAKEGISKNNYLCKVIDALGDNRKESELMDLKETILEESKIIQRKIESLRNY